MSKTEETEITRVLIVRDTLSVKIKQKKNIHIYTKKSKIAMPRIELTHHEYLPREKAALRPLGHAVTGKFVG